MKSLLLLLCMVLSAQAPSVITGGSVIRNAVIAAPASSAPDPVFNSLTHYWALDEAATGSRADSKGAINLTESGGSVAVGTGINGNCISISSSHFLANATDVFPGIGSASSLMFWFKAPALASLDCWNAASGPDGSPIVSLSANQLVPGNAGDGGGAVDYNYTANTWHLFVFVSDAGGVQSGSFDGAALQLSDTIESFSGHCYLGANWVSGTVLIDEAAVFNVALTDADCSNLWHGGSGIFWRP